MKIAWIDCSAGASGDMLLGALLDAGADLAYVNAAVAAVDPTLSVQVSRTARHQIAALKATVEVDGTPHPETVPGELVEGPAAEEPAPASAGHGHGHGHGHDSTHHSHGGTRPWSEVRRILEEAELPEVVRGRALDTFGRLARAEANAHGVDVEGVHFHEVGALDAIADIVGVAAASVSLGIERVVVSTIALGGGRQVKGQHGGIPIPGPAVLHLVAEAEAPVIGGTAPYEMTTPTGAALLATLADEFGMMPPMRVGRTGVGAGGRDPVEVPNILRVIVGETTERQATQLVYETNIDDLDPRLWPPVLQRLLDAGASDAWLTPILMKKGRPAHTLSVLVSSTNAAAVRRVVLTETTAIGLREYDIRKHAADREFTSIDVDGQSISIKIARYDGQVVNVQPEYEDVVAAAAELKQPVKAIMARAVAAAADFWN
ncbi:nickel pincer cofactor biosynthesis protein LarC [Kribbella sp. NPDC056951]|uniref:nickel pincer cofactor biosynthesis protein LarC n=1 Tax=Kribbella sp. NPDC056951 TaxID=3345978 RepID=UPI00363D9D9C